MLQPRNWLKAGNPVIYAGTIVVAFLIGAVFGLVVLGWLRSSPAPTPAVAVVTATSSPPSVGPTTITPLCDATPAGWVPYSVQAGDTLSELAARIEISQNRLLQANCLTSPELLAGQVLYLPSPATPTPCTLSPPSDWGVYTVQAGDTLSDLAAARETTTDQVLQVNCLTSSDFLIEGQQLYLPVLPTPTPTESPTPIPPPPLIPTPVAQPTTPPQPLPAPAPAIQPAPPSQLPSAVVPVDSKWNKRDQTLNPISVAVALPGGPYRPCRHPTPTTYGLPRISSIRAEVSPLPTPDRYNLEQGEREYYYACGFPDPATLTARIIGPNGPQPLDVQLYLPLREENYQVMNDEPQGVVVFNAICEKPLSSEVSYTLVMEDRQGGYAEHKFQVKPASIERILTIPQAGPAGTTFQVYYCGYTSQANQYIEIHLFYDTTDKPPTDFLTTYPIYPIHATSWTVFINKDGEGKQDLPSLSTDPSGRYFIRDRPEFGAEDVVRLLPNR
jgi:LysM repeat protein